MIVEVNEQLRNEIFLALVDRKAVIAKHVKDLQRDGMTKEGQLAEKRLALYATSGKVVGLLPMFADQTDLDEERAKKGETRKDDGTADMFGGGIEVGGTPAPKAPEPTFMGKGGKLFHTDDEAQASFKLPDADATTAAAADEATDVGAPIPQPPIPSLKLLNGGDAEPVDAEFTVEDADDSEEGGTDAEVDDEALEGEEGDGDAADSETATERQADEDAAREWRETPLRTTPEA